MVVELEALGTKWWITLPADIHKKIVDEVKSMISEFEENYSRFKDSSYIGKLNNHKVLPSPPEELLNMLTYALDVHAQTDGIFNISIGAELEKSGYGKKSDASSKVSNHLLEDISLTEKVISLKNHVRIDLGGFGKGWLIEKLAAYLKNENVSNFIINGGGDITAHGKAETIYIENPNDQTEYIGKVLLQNSSLASSSNLKRQWQKDRKDYAHILHPDGKTLENILSMHVMADNILFADTFATIFLLVDRDTRLEYAERYGFEFMEVLNDLTTFRTQSFPFIPNQD